MNTRIALYKRVMDIVISLTILVMVSPLLLIVALAIRIESKGPVFYHQLRAGRNYRIFKFYKFRSMYADADKRVSELLNQSQYGHQYMDKPIHLDLKDEELIRVSDEEIVSEKVFLSRKDHKPTFFKLENDPRITRVGSFIRKTSIDELPQLLNVLIGDMSIVGNRPLPLYEAEKLTSDIGIERFRGPAGITGLWQVTDRGKKNVSEAGRIAKDVYYTRKYNLWLDLWILLRTPFAAIQQSNV